MKKKKNKTKVRYVDDGHTIYSMEGLDGRKTEKNGEKLSRKEKRAAIKAAFLHYGPILLMVLASFSVAAILVYLWFR